MIVIEKNILIIFGSPNKDGHTRKMVNRLENSLKGYNFFEFNAYDEMIKPCMGCNKCMSSGECFLDDFKKLEYFFKYLKPEILVLASPVYNFGFPSPVKAILDRLQPYYYNPIVSNSCKKAILLLSSGRKLHYEKEVIKALNIILKPLGFKVRFSCFWDETDVDRLEKGFQVLNCVDDIKNKLDLSE